MELLPKIKVIGLQQDGQLFPHVSTSDRSFSFDLELPESILQIGNELSLFLKLFGIHRGKHTESRYGKDMEASILDTDLVELRESVLIVDQISLSKQISSETNNGFKCTLTTSNNSNLCKIDCSLKRNHWDRNRKDKYLMFALQVSLSDLYSTTFRVYAQKISRNSENVTEKVELIMKNVTEVKGVKRSLREISEAETQQSPKRQFMPAETFDRGIELVQLDLSPLPSELIVHWSSSDEIINMLENVLSSPETGDCLNDQNGDKNSEIFALEMELIRETKLIQCE
jgi:hypothetical protein